MIYWEIRNPYLISCYVRRRAFSRRAKDDKLNDQR
jgi:hypothetical protein